MSEEGNRRKEKPSQQPQQPPPPSEGVDALVVVPTNNDNGNNNVAVVNAGRAEATTEESIDSGEDARKRPPPPHRDDGPHHVLSASSSSSHSEKDCRSCPPSGATDVRISPDADDAEDHAEMLAELLSAEVVVAGDTSAGRTESSSLQVVDGGDTGRVAAAGEEQEQEELIVTTQMQQPPPLVTMLMMSQTDQHIRRLDRGGELNEVAGSQSLLSQELMDHASSSQPGGGGDDEDMGDNGNEGDNDGNEGDNDEVALNGRGVAGLVEGDFHLSQQTETSIGMAQRLGLLSQTQDDLYYDDNDNDDDDDNDVDEGAPGRRAMGNLLTQGVEEARRRGPICGLDLLTRAGNSNEAEVATLMLLSQEGPTGAAAAATSAANVELSDDIPVRDGEGFGSLLDAVAKITEQEEEVVDGLTPSWDCAAVMSSLDHASLTPSRDASYLLPPTSTPSLSVRHRRSKRDGTATRRGASPTGKRQVLKRNPAKAQKRKLKVPGSDSNAAMSKATSPPSKTSSSKTSRIRSSSDAAKNAPISKKTAGPAKKCSPPRKRKGTTKAPTAATTTASAAAATSAQNTQTQKKGKAASARLSKPTATEQKEDGRDVDIQQAHQAEAKRAAELAERTISDPLIAKRLLLSMALVRENPRSAPDLLPGPGHVLQEGFFWAHYPPLELVLKK
jgi:hypothetical protein